jgi:hypothetical protein
LIAAIAIVEVAVVTAFVAANEAITTTAVLYRRIERDGYRTRKPDRLPNRPAGWVEAAQQSHKPG